MATEVTVWPGFFNTLGIHLLSGRNFQLTDDEKHPHLAVVSKSLAERLFPNGDAIGQHVRYGFWPDFQNLEIVGVAQDARILQPRDAAPPVIYLSYLQGPPWDQFGTLYVRTKENPNWSHGGPCRDRKSTRLNSSHGYISYAVFCLKKKNNTQQPL